MVEDIDVTEGCICEDTPLIVYCKKCGNIYVVANDMERIDLSEKSEKKLRKILKEEMKENYNFFTGYQDD
jgi:hypothetical protein